MSDVEAVKKAHESQLLAISGVVGVGIVAGALGTPAIGVYVTHAGVASAVPKTLEGIEVIVEVSGEIDALRPPD